MKEFAICSNGYREPNPKHLRKSEKRLLKLQRDLSRKKSGTHHDRDINASKNLLKLAI